MLQVCKIHRLKQSVKNKKALNGIFVSFRFRPLTPKITDSASESKKLQSRRKLRPFAFIVSGFFYPFYSAVAKENLLVKRRYHQTNFYVTIGLFFKLQFSVNYSLKRRTFSSFLLKRK